MASEIIPRMLTTSDEEVKQTLAKLDSILRKIEGIPKTIMNTVDFGKIMFHISGLKNSCAIKNFEDILKTYSSGDPFVLFVCPVRLQNKHTSLVVSEESKEVMEAFFKMTNRHRECVVILPSGGDAEEAVSLVSDLYREKLEDNNIGVFANTSDVRNYFYRRNALFCLMKFCHLIESIDIRRNCIIEKIVIEALREKCSYEHMKQICRNADLYDHFNRANVGNSSSRSYVCRFVVTINRIRKDLNTKALEALASSISEKITLEILKSVERNLKMVSSEDLEIIRKLYESKLFLFKDILTIIKAIFLTFLYPIVFLFMLVRYLFWYVDVNSPGWRDKIADEIWTIIWDNMDKLKANLVPKVQTLLSNALKDINEMKMLAENEVKRLMGLVRPPVQVALHPSDEHVLTLPCFREGSVASILQRFEAR